MSTASSAAAELLDPSSVRTKFSSAISRLYQDEVPLYTSLLSAVSGVNTGELSLDPSLESQLRSTGELSRLSLERHGAIRLGGPSELATMGRLFGVMGMHAVGYYDLSTSGVPVHATCFRPYHVSDLSKNPFRMFTSLLRPELLPQPLRDWSKQLLAKRQIFSPRVLELVAIAEAQGGLSDAQADEFVGEAINIFAWNPKAVVTLDEYNRLATGNPLLADVLAFPNPHINHLTPRTLNIDKVQSRMGEVGISAKDAIEGPPARQCPILLRQTSFKALEEPVLFPSEESAASGGIDYVQGAHRARFGEIEERGAALTPKGLQLYHSLLSEARSGGLDSRSPRYAEIFSGFPDTWKEIHEAGLAWFQYLVSRREGFEPGKYQGLPRADLEAALIRDGVVSYEPLVYEDFLPVSAAGIFQSNLDLAEGEEQNEAFVPDQAGFEAALGGLEVRDQMVLYEASQRESMERCLAELKLCGS